MTKEMTPSILKFKGSKPKLNLIGIAHHTGGKKCTQGNIVNQSLTLKGYHHKEPLKHLYEK
jgi:hypothetical protein